MPASSTTQPHALKNNRKTIAVLAGSMTSKYQEGILRGVAHIAEERNYNVIGFCGGVVKAADPLAQVRGTVFDLVDMNLISGVISPFSPHMRFLDDESSQRFIDRFSRVPIINIGSHIDGHTNVLTDYETGFNELFEHLYHAHGHRNILLVRGPKNHASSEKRMQIYKRLLNKYNLPYYDDRVIYANLNRASTKTEVESFIRQNNQPFDAIIAINDNQALAIIEVLKDNGIRVPQDVAVIGSMNTLDGVFATPALTSIQEPLFELGCAAAIELIDQIEGKPLVSEIYIPTSLVIRKSCGCHPSNYNTALGTLNEFDTNAITLQNDPIYEETKIYFERHIKEYKRGSIREQAFTFLTLYQEAIHNKKCSVFLEELEKTLEVALKSEDIIIWLTLVSRLELNTLRYLELDPTAQHLITFLAKFMTLKNDIELIAIKFLRFESEYYLNYFRAVVNNLNSSFDLATIKKYTVDVLKLSDLYISIFDDVDADVVHATNVESMRNNQTLTPKNQSFVAKRLLPDDIESYQERFTLVVFPLSFRTKAFGFMTVNLSRGKGTAFENLRAIISSALNNEILISDLKKAEKRFSDIAHSTSNWLWETDAENRFTYCSNSSLDIIGYSPAQLLGKKVNEFNVNDNCLEDMLTNDYLTNVECWYTHQNGHVICLLLSAKPIITKGIFKGYRGVFEDITEQRRQEHKIKNLAYSDTLTGLPNRTSFQDKLTEVITISSTENSKFALMFIDLDHFKNVNDSMGHAAGDLLLIRLAERLNQSIRANDMVARLGGDEFIIILPDIENEDEVAHIAECIFHNIQEPIMIYGKPVYSALSLGISLYPLDGKDAQSLLQKGDNAMYKAKSQGRNCYAFYDNALAEKHALRNLHEEILREALATDGFILHYQPQVEALSGDIIGFEALIRIKDKKGKIIAPNNFISLAEELGLIGKIDEWVFEEACSRYRLWRERGLKPVRLSVNLSALQLRKDSVLDTYIEILERYNVEPEAIQVEITENTLIENEEAAFKILTGFKEYGVSIALDDFGTGYSSLTCISLYPIDTIKIDRSFVKDVVDNQKHKAIIEGIVLIASSLNLNIIAEGVETIEQYEVVKQLGCHEIQGYYFHQPCTLKDAETLLENASPLPLK